jgi:hypothetical protein
MVIFQRRRVIAQSIALSCIFFNKPSPPGFGREKKRDGEEIPRMRGAKQPSRVSSLAHEQEQK